MNGKIKFNLKYVTNLKKDEFIYVKMFSTVDQDVILVLDVQINDSKIANMQSAKCSGQRKKVSDFEQPVILNRKYRYNFCHRNLFKSLIFLMLSQKFDVSVEVS